jgi:EmrB/QacA subfamily drug resistance transporter
MTSKQRWILVLASMASFMVALDALVVATALTTIRSDLNASLETLEWTMNSYNLSFAVLLMTGAALGDRFGRRRVFMIGLGIFSVSSAACALSPNVAALITFRTLQGVGAAIILPLALTLISAGFSPERRGKALGLFSGVTGLATLSGPFIGGVVAEGLAWQWIFWINIPIGIAAMLLVLVRIDESHGPNNRLDIGGLVLVTIGTLALVWGLVRGNTLGWSSPEISIALAGGLVFVIAFVGWERRAAAPMLPMRFFRVRAFTTANTANFCLYASLYGTLFLLAQYLQTALHHGPLGAGLRLMPWTATLMVCAPIAGALADRVGERRFMVGGLLLQTIGMGWLAAIATAETSYAQMVVPLIVSGCGISMGMPAAQKSVVGAVAVREVGQASGAITTLRIFGGVFGIAVLSAVFAARGGYESAQTFADGFAAAMAGAAIAAFVGAAIALGMPGRKKSPNAAAAPAPVAAVPVEATD